MPDAASTATTELGYPGGIAAAGIASSGGGAYYVDGLEANLDLRHPLSAMIYDRMRREDGQVGSVLRAVTQPILATRATLDGGTPGEPGACRPEVVAMVERELGLDAQGATSRRRREGIVWRQHLREALLMLPLGFMCFEPVYSVGPAAPGLADPTQPPDRLYAHLAKLAPRLPRTIREVRVARDGGLLGVVQEPPPGATGRDAIDGVFIPVERLVMYVNDREGADWHGQSVLRQAYKSWLIKDVLIRLGAQIVERNGMGIPVATYTDPALKAEANQIVTNWRAGATAGVVVPEGITLDLLGVTGSLVDELPRLTYHDQAISRSLLAMFLDLGHDAGARSLGDTFLGLFLASLEAITTNVADTVTEHVIRDLVELNYGPDEPYPSLRFDKITEPATADALSALAGVGLITPDGDLEDELRARLGLRAKPVTEDKVTDAASSPFTSVGLPALVAGGIISAAEGRQLLGVQGPPPAAIGPAPGPVVAGAVTAASAGDDDLLTRLERLTATVAALRGVTP